MYHVAIAVATRHLHQAETIPVRVKSHRFAVDGDDIAESEPRRKVIYMQMICHTRLGSLCG